VLAIPAHLAPLRLRAVPFNTEVRVILPSERSQAPEQDSPQALPRRQGCKDEGSDAESCREKDQDTERHEHLAVLTVPAPLPRHPWSVPSPLRRARKVPFLSVGKPV
jgi:hypothetical protein